MSTKVSSKPNSIRSKAPSVKNDNNGEEDVDDEDMVLDESSIMDAPNMNALAKYKIDEILIRAINSGVNLFIFPNHAPFCISPKWFMQPERFIYIITKAIKNGQIPIERIEESYQKIIRIKEKLN